LRGGGRVNETSFIITLVFSSLIDGRLRALRLAHSRGLSGDTCALLVWGARQLGKAALIAETTTATIQYGPAPRPSSPYRRLSLPLHRTVTTTYRYIIDPLPPYHRCIHRPLSPSPRTSARSRPCRFPCVFSTCSSIFSLDSFPTSPPQCQPL